MATDKNTTAQKPPRKSTRNKPGPKPGAKAAAAAAGAAPTSDAPAAPAKPTERSPFLYKNRDYLTITETGQKGQVRARAEYASGAVAYLLAYSSNGDLKEAWIDQELVSPFVERRARPA